MRVLITGASGSGTTTLGRALADALKAPFFDVDDYFWLPSEPPYQQQRDPAARLSLLAGDLARAPRAVIAGSVIQWGQVLEDSFSLVVFLTLQPEVRLARLRRRETARFGQPDPKFIDWAAQYDDGQLEVNSRTGDERWLAGRSCTVLRIEGSMSTRERVAEVAQALGSKNGKKGG
jgi:adenylate kinase family enzyme